MYRNISVFLKNWQNSNDRLPLLLRGARQVGKTHTIVEFGKDNFTETIVINFEQQREYLSCFNSLNPKKIIELIYALSGKKIIPGKTLLFLDEIQECPNAIMALRYFYEQLPEQAIIGAGSLLEFTLRNSEFKMPVGRVQSCYLKPMSFAEFLIASKKIALLELLDSVSLQDSIEQVIHEELISLVRSYLALGGMPAVIKNYLAINDLEQCNLRQGIILDSYRQDFGKYAKHTDIKYLQSLLDRAPGLVAKHFKYRDIDPDVHSRNIKRALYDLIDAGIIYKNHASKGIGLPLASSMNEKKFKLFFLDVGLMNKAMGLTGQILLNEEFLLLNRGAITEQFVAQELLTLDKYFQRDSLFYWERQKRTSSAEVDFLINIDTTIVPIEVKSGYTGKLKSLHMLMENNKLSLGVKISQDNFSFDGKVLSLPLYMITQLPRLVREYIN